VASAPGETCLPAALNQRAGDPGLLPFSAAMVEDHCLPDPVLRSIPAPISTV